MGALVFELVPLAIVALLLWRLEPLAVRLLSVIEKRTEMLEASMTKGIPAKEPMPADLYAHTLAEAEPWARDQILEHINELYDTLGDWGLVRTALLTGKVDDGS